MRGFHRPQVDWDTYLTEFHAAKPGITERVLARCTYRGTNPYAWLLEGIADTDRVLDLACGSAPTRRADSSLWIGIDRSTAELAEARSQGAALLVLADANRLPLACHSFDTVVCAMALMLFTPLERVLREVARVLRPGGQLHAIVPSTRPLTWTDRVHIAQLSATLRTPPRFPASPVTRHATRTFKRHGFDITSDTRRRYHCSVTSGADVSLFIDGLYLPGVSASRLRAAHNLATDSHSRDLGIPVRKITAIRRISAG